MNIFSDWKFWMFTISVCQLGLMTYGFVVIKFNDLKHLAKDVTKIQKDLEKNTSMVIRIDKEHAVQNQRITALEK